MKRIAISVLLTLALVGCSKVEPSTMTCDTYLTRPDDTRASIAKEVHVPQGELDRLCRLHPYDTVSVVARGFVGSVIPA